MPFGQVVVCCKCKSTESEMWWRCSDPDGICCNTCYFGPSKKIAKDCRKILRSNVQKPPKSPVKRKTKTSRKARPGPSTVIKPFSSKVKVKKENVEQEPPPEEEPVVPEEVKPKIITSDCVYYKGEYFRTGDIVSVQDVGGGIYYAQIRKLMANEYCEKTAYITWLIPTLTDLPYVKKGFDPRVFVIGPDDEEPRNLECLEFVMHPPSDYFRYSYQFNNLLTEWYVGSLNQQISTWTKDN